LPPETYEIVRALFEELQSEHEHREEKSQALGRLVPVS